jgi:hypothetical protein
MLKSSTGEKYSMCSQRPWCCLIVYCYSFTDHAWLVVLLCSVGEWNVNERHGFGSIYYPNGGKQLCTPMIVTYCLCFSDSYSGDWKHNKKHGHGVYRFADGKIVEGEWQDNKHVVCLS